MKKKYKKYLIESSIFNVGDRVEGKYIDGSKFVGSIKSRRFHTINSNIIMYNIRLDKPYKGRSDIIIDWDINTNKALNDAELKISKKKLTQSVMDKQKKKEIEDLKKMLADIPRVFGKTPRAEKERKEIEDEIKKLQGK